MARIGIDARLTHYRTGGISTYIKRILAALEQLRGRHDFTVFQSRKSKSVLAERFRLGKLWTPPHHPWERAALSLELLRHRLDLMHSPDFIAPWRGAKRHIITVHDLSFIHYPEYITAASRRYYNAQIEDSVKRSDHILADSQATKRDLMDILDVPAPKITVHLLGVDERFRPLPSEVSRPVIRALGLPDEYILFVGTIEPRKNLVGLARAYRDLLLEMADLPKLVIAGRLGWHTEELMADFADAGINRQVIFRHALADEQLPALYNHALALVMPSFYEGFGLPALEAMACGATPIVSRAASLPEIVGDVGLLFDPHDTAAIAQALKKALTDSAWRERQSQAGLERARMFSWRTTAGIVQKSYEAALG